MGDVSRIRQTIAAGVDFWNDSCDLRELSEAVDAGAVGATSNPVIVGQAVEAAPGTWNPVLDALIREEPRAREDEIAWALVRRVAVDAARLLAPVHAATGGRKGYLCVQVDPRLFRDAGRMVEHGAALASLAPNVAVKIPATAAGVGAIEELTSRGVRINATVCFTIAQAVACAEAVERGLARAKTAGRDVAALVPNVTVMIGRLDDHLRRVADAQAIDVDPGIPHRAGIAVFKKAWRVFRERGYRAVPLAAAYRHSLHWTELVGPGLVQTIPYAWWKRFDASAHEPRPTIEEPVAADVAAALRGSFPDFRAAEDEDGLRPDDFASYGPSVHTLRQFCEGLDRLTALVRARLVR